MDKQRLEQRYKAYRDYKAEGHTMAEVADRFGISVATANYVCKGIAPQPSITEETRVKGHKTTFPKREAKAIETIRTFCIGFEYVDGYTNSDGYVNLRCVKCGNVDAYSYTTIRQGGAIQCKPCIANERRAKAEARAKEKAEAKRIAEQRREQRRRDKEAERFAHSFIAVCSECGKQFIAKRKDQVCCSSECTRHRSWHRKDRRISGDKRIDKDITAKNLYKRDKGVCWICGGKCDLKDYKKVNGVVICGNNYPSVDHVIPVCKGGEDSWDNVRLAHRRCNTLRYSHGKNSPRKIIFHGFRQSEL